MYQALYRKYRPQTFSDVVGQKSVTDTLRAQLETGRLSHAYLFTGTRGTGKTSCAKILAKAVNCENPNHGDPCGVCPSCRAIDEGSCMDVLEIDAASNNGVDSVRVLRDDAIYTPGTVKMRVYIIDEVHMLSTAAFNALLKIIEEPPAHLLFILATTELQKVPATILSRCQRFAFKRLRAEEIASRLNFIAYQEHIEIEPDAVNLLARLADGGMRDGVSLLDQCASAAGGAVTLESVYASLGLAGERRTAELMQAIAQQDTAKALTVFSSLYAAGKDVGALLGEMCALCRDLLVLHTAPKSGLAMLSGIATEQQALALQDMFSPGELMRVLTETQKTRASFGKNTDVRVAAELLLMQLCEPALRLDAQALNARISRVEEQLASGVLVKAAPQTSGDEYDDDRPPFPDDADDPARGQLPEMPPAQPAPARAEAGDARGLLARALGKAPGGAFGQGPRLLRGQRPAAPRAAGRKHPHHGGGQRVRARHGQKARHRAADPRKGVRAAGQARRSALRAQEPGLEPRQGSHGRARAVRRAAQRHFYDKIIFTTIRRT